MSWLGALAGVVLVWIAGEWFGWRGGGLLVLAAVGGAWIGALHRRIGRSEDEWRERLARLESRLRSSERAGEPATVPVRASAASPEAGPPAAAAVPRDLSQAAAPTAAEEHKAAIDLPAAPPPARERAADTGRPASTWATPAARRVPPEVEESALGVTTSLARSVRAWFAGGNTIVRIGAIVLFFGVAFLLRWAAEQALLPIELRIGALALGGLALAVVGWRLRESRRGYALTLQGAGVGIVYLTLFAALRLYQLLPPALAFALLALLAAVAALLAVRQNALPLAVLGFGGGFLAPVLTSSGSGNHVALFGFYLLLNLAIAWIASRKAWKLLNLVGLVFTFSIGALWGVRAYTPAHFATTEPFLVAHFLLYLFIAVQYTRQLVAANDGQAAKVPVVDGGLLFGVPIAAFGLQAAMLRDEPTLLASSAALLAAIYLTVGWRLWREAGERMLLLVEGLLALGVVFLLLVTPLALDARWTGAAWAVQGAGILWVALRQQRWWAAALGGALQIVAAFVHLDRVQRAADTLPWANAAFVGSAMVAAALLVSAWLLHRHAARQDSGSTLARALHAGHALALALGTAQTVIGAWPEVRQMLAPWLDPSVRGALLLATVVLALELSRPRLAWPELGIAARVVLLLAFVFSLVASANHLSSAGGLWSHVGPRGAWFEVLLLAALGAWLLRRHAVWPAEPVAWAWFALLQSGVIAYAAFGAGVARHLAWTHAFAVAVPTVFAVWLLHAHERGQWPLAGRWRAFDLGLLRPWMVAMALWSLAANLLADGKMAPLPYLPIANPIDIAHVLVAIFGWQWWRAAGRPRPAWGLGLAAAVAFWWLNAVLVRSLHHWADTPMWMSGALDSSTVHTGLTILWTLIALVTMLLATRRAMRLAWTVGAALLGVVVLKLFFVDLSNVGTLARIVSFLGVGALMLVIGYLSPIPPPKVQEQRA